MRLTILHTNDIHSNYENFAKIVTKIRELQDESTIILDAGDFADFKRFELLGTHGLAALDLLEAAGCDAIAVGNNETFQGHETLINMITNSKIRVTINGKKLREDQWYTVASSDYLQRGTGYPSMGKNKNESYRKEYLRDVLREYISKKEFIERAYVDRWILSQNNRE